MRSTTGFFFVQTTCGTFPAVSNQPLSSFFAYRSYSASNCDSFLGTPYYGNGHTSVTRVRHRFLVFCCFFPAVPSCREHCSGRSLS